MGPFAFGRYCWLVSREIRGEIVNSKLAIPAMCVGLLGVVGGVAAANAFQPVEKPAPVVQIAPAAETVEPTVDVTTQVPAPVATTEAPAPAPSTTAPKPAPVESTTSEPAPAPVKEAPVAPKAAPVPAPVQTSAAPKPEIAPDDPIRQTPPPPVPGNIVPGQPLDANPTPTAKH